jgi:hypothetical protein
VLKNDIRQPVAKLPMALPVSLPFGREPLEVTLEGIKVLSMEYANASPGEGFAPRAREFFPLLLARNTPANEHFCWSQFAVTHVLRIDDRFVKIGPKHCNMYPVSLAHPCTAMMRARWAHIEQLH